MYLGDLPRPAAAAAPEPIPGTNEPPTGAGMTQTPGITQEPVDQGYVLPPAPIPPYRYEAQFDLPAESPAPVPLDPQPSQVVQPMVAAAQTPPTGVVVAGASLVESVAPPASPEAGTPAKDNSLLGLATIGALVWLMLILGKKR